MNIPNSIVDFKNDFVRSLVQNVANQNVANRDYDQEEFEEYDYDTESEGSDQDYNSADEDYNSNDEDNNSSQLQNVPYTNYSRMSGSPIYFSQDTLSLPTINTNKPQQQNTLNVSPKSYLNTYSQSANNNQPVIQNTAKKCGTIENPVRCRPENNFINAKKYITTSPNDISVETVEQYVSPDNKIYFSKVTKETEKIQTPSNVLSIGDKLIRFAKSPAGARAILNSIEYSHQIGENTPEEIQWRKLLANIISQSFQGNYGSLSNTPARSLRIMQSL